MIRMLNDRDVLLQSAPLRSVAPAANAALLLTTDCQVFHLNAAGVGTPSVSNLVAQRLALEGAITFSTEPPVTLTGTGDVRQLALSDLTVPQVKVTASLTHISGVVFSSTMTISKVQDGSVGLTNSIVYAYQRATSAPSGSPGVVTYTFASAQITTPAGNDLANGWKKTIPAGTEPLYVTAATAAGSGTTDTIQAAEWAAPVVMAQNGLSSASLTIYKRSSVATPPATPTGTATYTFNPPGLTGLTDGWSSAVPASSGGAYLYVSTATAVSSGATDTIAPSEWASAQLLAADGPAGAPGKSARVAFTLIDGFSLANTPGTVTVAGDTRPPTGTWGETRVWKANIDAAQGVNQAWFQSAGTYDPVANTTTWSVPFMSNLKVGVLSSLANFTGALIFSDTCQSANGNVVINADGTFLLRSGPGAAGLSLTGSLLAMRDDSGVLRGEFGLLS